VSSTSTTNGTASKASRTRGRHRAARFGIRSVDLGEQRRDHRRTGRRFDRLQAGALRHVEMVDPFADFQRDLVAFAVALGLRRQVDLHVAHMRAGAQDNSGAPGR
jgi:hypothetical protein